MQESITVLVLGVGGNVSQGILKSLALSDIPCRVIGACINPLSAGLYTVDRSYVSPFADDPLFLDWLISTCLANSVQAILSGVEPILKVMALHAEKIRLETGTMCIVSNPKKLAIGNDKLATCRWLESNKLNHPLYAPSYNIQEIEKLVTLCGYPLIAKPRYGKGSQGILIVKNEGELASVAGRSDYIVQEYLSDLNEEFTVGCFCDRDGIVRGSIAMRRELSYGTTYRAIVGDFPKVNEEAVRITEALKPMGPCNIQLRVTERGPVCFEINMRFSGTTPMRARLGFNEVDAALRNFIINEPIANLPVIIEGVILRYWNEIYIDKEASALLQKEQKLDDPGEFDIFVENYGVN